MLIKTACAACSAEFQAARFSARYCSSACRNRAYRERRKAAPVEAAGVTEPVTDQPPQDAAGISMAQATLAELAAAKREGTSEGLGALALARRIDGYGAVESGGALAALVREHAAALARALDVRITELDPFDELERKRAERRANGG